MEKMQTKYEVLRDYIIPTTVLENGVRQGDEFELTVFQKGKRIIKLTRTFYQLKSGSDYKMDYQNCLIELPTYNLESINCEIRGVVNHKNEMRYILKSKGESPFKLNGNWSFESYLERGDVLDIGLNIFKFARPEVGSDKTLIPSSIVKSKICILIEGETGTGKTRLAKFIHDESEVNGNFVHLNLSSYSANLIESELFGHTKGAFTGAISDKKGAILEANKGTLFLDEIDSVSIEIQTKLLLFLESLEFRAVGSERCIKADTRIIVASGTKLSSLVSQSKIRKDFFYRLSSGYSVYLESLRENKSRIKALCEEFEAREYTVITEELKLFYSELKWPGNIRQLVSHLQKKKVIASGKKIGFDHHDQCLLDERLLLDENVGFINSLETMKFNYCISVFNKLNQNKRAACKVLDISPNTLKKILETEAA